MKSEPGAAQNRVAEESAEQSVVAVAAVDDQQPIDARFLEVALLDAPFAGKESGHVRQRELVFRISVDFVIAGRESRSASLPC